MATNMWEQTEEMAKKHDADSSTWLKLANDEDKAVVVFLGEPYPREVSFVDGKYVPADDAVRAAGHKVSLRVAYNVVVPDTGEVKVLEQGVMFFKDLVRVREKYGLDKWAFEVQRHGAAKDPKTTYSILPERQLTAEERKSFQAVEVLDLPKLYAGEAEKEPATEETAPERAHRPEAGDGHRHAAQGDAAAGGRPLPRAVRHQAHQGPSGRAVGAREGLRREARRGVRRAGHDAGRGRPVCLRAVHPQPK